MKRILISAMLIFSAVTAMAAGPGEQSPNLIGRTMDDKLYRLYSDKKVPKVINFFWVGCKPCKEEMPELAKLEREFPGVRFISVHAMEERPENVAAFVKSLPGAPSNIVLSTEAVKDTFMYAGLPHTVVLDKNNTVKLNMPGYTPKNMGEIRKVLKEFTANQ